MVMFIIAVMLIMVIMVIRTDKSEKNRQDRQIWHFNLILQVTFVGQLSQFLCCFTLCSTKTYFSNPKVTGSRLTLNTSSFVTYAQVYELSLIVSKDTRKGMVKMDIDLGVLPVPLLEIDCAAPGLCFPTFGGIFVNPTSRFFVLTIRLFQRKDHQLYWLLTRPGWLWGALATKVARSA